MAKKATDKKLFPPFMDDDLWVSKKLEPTAETICDFLTELVRTYFAIALLTDPDMGHPPKGRKKKRGIPLTPQQRAAQDFGATWAMETFGEGESEIRAEVYTWRGVRMRFFMANKEFKVVP